MALWSKRQVKFQVPQEPVKIPEPMKEEVIVEAPAPIPEPVPVPPAPEPEKKAPPNRARPFDHHIRLSNEEERKLQIRAEKASLSTGIFIRKAALENPIVVDPHKEELLAAIQKFTAELKFIHSELGKQGGMLKMAIKPNEGQKEASPEEWKLLVETNHNTVATQKMVWKTMEAINGYFKAHQF